MQPFQKGRGRPLSQGPTPKEEELLNIIIKWLHEKGFSPSIMELCEEMGVKSSSTVHAHLRKLRAKGYITWDPTKPRTISLCGFERIGKLGLKRPRASSAGAPGVDGGKDSVTRGSPTGPSHPPIGFEGKSDMANDLACTDDAFVSESGKRASDAYASLCRRGVVVPLIRRVRTGTLPFLDEDIMDDIPIPWELARDDTAFALRVRTSGMSGAGILRDDLIIVRRQEYANPGDIVISFAEGRVVIRHFTYEDDVPVLRSSDDLRKPPITANFRVLGKVTGVLRSIE